LHHARCLRKLLAGLEVRYRGAKLQVLGPVRIKPLKECQGWKDKRDLRNKNLRSINPDYNQLAVDLYPNFVADQRMAQRESHVKGTFPISGS
jgi:hypothetical protein